MRQVFAFIFGGHVFEVAGVTLLGTGVSLALSSDRGDAVKAHWFFGVAFLLALGRGAQLITAWKQAGAPRYLVAALLFASLGSSWIVVYDWVEKKVTPASPAKPVAEVSETKAPGRSGDPEIEAVRVRAQRVINKLQAALEAFQGRVGPKAREELIANGNAGVISKVFQAATWNLAASIAREGIGREARTVRDLLLGHIKLLPTRNELAESNYLGLAEHPMTTNAFVAEGVLSDLKLLFAQFEQEHPR